MDAKTEALKGNWNSSPESPSPEPQSQPPPYPSIPHSPLPDVPAIIASWTSRSGHVSSNLSGLFPPDSHKPIHVARRDNGERLYVACGGVGTTGGNPTTRLLNFFLTQNLGLWPVQVQSDSVEPEPQKQIE